MNGVLIPQRIFVGDTAQFLFLLSEKEYANLTRLGFTAGEPIPPKNITQNDMMTVNEIRIVKREAEYYLTITFVPWETGEIDFPALSFLPLHTKLPTITVSSLLANGERISLQPPKPPLLPPGTDFLLYGATVLSAGFLALFSTGAWLLLRKLRKKTVGTAKKRLAVLRNQLKRLYKAAKKIQKHLPQHGAAFGRNQVSAAADTIANEGAAGISRNPTDAGPCFTGGVEKNTKRAIESWYAAIDRCLREYIRALCTDNTLAASAKDEAYFLSATYTELTKTLTEIITSKQEIADLFCIFYAMLERQRFGSGSSELLRNYTAVSQNMLKQLPRIAEKAETEYAALVSTLKTASSNAADQPNQEHS